MGVTGMSAESVDLGFSGLTTPAGAHVGYPYASEDKRYRNLLGFIAAGLQRKEKCVAAISEYTPGFLSVGLRARGLNPDTLPKGQLEVITAARFARDTIAESVQTALDLLGNSLETSDGQDWAGLRVCTSFMHLYQHRQALSDLLAAEMEMDQITHARKVIMLCTFSTSMMHPQTLETTLSTHQFITDGQTLRPNEGYTAPSQLAPKLLETLNRLEQAGAFVPPCAQLCFHADTPVICTCQEMDLYTSPRLEELANMLIGMSHRRLVVDLSSTTYLDASTIGVLIRIARALENKGGQLALYDPKDPIRKIFRIVNLDEYIPIYRSLQSAVDKGHMSAAA